MRYLTLLIIMLGFILTGCAATVIPKQVDQLKKICEPYLGQTTEVFLENNPSAEVTVIDIDSNKFRYRVRNMVPCSFEEALLAPTGLSNRCWYDIYFFSEKGVIVRYSMQRGSLY